MSSSPFLRFPRHPLMSSPQQDATPIGVRKLATFTGRSGWANRDQCAAHAQLARDAEFYASVGNREMAALCRRRMRNLRAANSSH